MDAEGYKLVSRLQQRIKELEAKCAELQEQYDNEYLAQLKAEDDYCQKIVTLEAKCAAMQELKRTAKQLHDMVLIDRRTDIQAASATVIHAYRKLAALDAVEVEL